MNIVMVGAECAPWSKTGGLGDVMGALPKALARRGHRVMVVAPRYENYDEAWETGVRQVFKVFGGDVEVSGGRFRGPAGWGVGGGGGAGEAVSKNQRQKPAAKPNRTEPNRRTRPPPQVGYFHGFIDGVDYVFVDHPSYHFHAGDIYGGDRADIQFRCALRAWPCGLFMGAC